MKTQEQMYLEFRKEIDEICVPEILKCVTTIPIKNGGKQVGIFCYALQPGHYYIDCLYVEPEHRRKGLAKNAVLFFYEYVKSKEYFIQEIRLHIINENKAAYAFWKSIFELEIIEQNFVDTLYRVKCLNRVRCP